ncbi:RMD1 family protein [Desulfosporosinus sp. Sb-LF]|uniref:RMD1 family protein n=1 Tax=Desulfosporosinus sp. Sb-LF TaxID=2560027 RepID=UPI00107F475F|nr:RMD1 family protein [Desulfosporosinus sp. Sb-LF]TGE31755.1 RMD1 family protein [Desulfosporosinus sp. Sb-LF]
MNDLKFKAYAVTNEIDLNKIAVECNIRKKYTWEEPLLLQDEVLGKIIGEKPGEDENILVFSFGSIVFINSTQQHTEPLMRYLKSIKSDIDIGHYDRFQEDYILHPVEGEEIEFTDRYVQISNMALFHPQLVSIVIAKSVALERIEEQLGKILDDLESKIDNLEKGKLNIGNRELAKTTSRIVRHEYNTIAYIMILDKPDITWINSDAADFYEKMSEFFELNDRYEVIKSKTEILKSIIDGLASISHSIRGLFVEWVIVLLIVIEVVLMVLDLIR